MGVFWAFLKEIDPRLAQGVLTVVAAFVAGLVATVTGFINHALERRREREAEFSKEQLQAYAEVVESMNIFSYVAYRQDVSPSFYSDANLASMGALSKVMIYGSSESISGVLEFDSAIRVRRKLIKNTSSTDEEKKSADLKIKNTRLKMLVSLRRDVLLGRKVDEMPTELSKRISRNDILEENLPVSVRQSVIERKVK